MSLFVLFVVSALSYTESHIKSTVLQLAILRLDMEAITAMTDLSSYKDNLENYLTSVSILKSF